MDEAPKASTETPGRRSVNLAVVVVIGVLVALVPAVIVYGLVYGFKSWNFRWSDRVAVFEGGSGETEIVWTPQFQVENNWIADVELTGSFSRVTLTKLDEQEGYEETELVDSKQPTKRINKSVLFGGRYSIRFDGSGTWKATIRQPR